MFEIFSKWINLKFKITNNKSPLFSERDVYWCSLGHNVGDEEYGKGELFARPVVVLKKYNKNLFFGIPMTTQIKENPYYFKLTFKNKSVCALLSQGRALDSKRLGAKMGTLTKNDYQNLKNAFVNQF